MKLLIAGAVVAGCLLLGAAGPKSDAKPLSIWAAEPSPEQIAAQLPEPARRSEAGGYAAMRCKVTADAGLTACRLVQETPSGLGLGQALLALAPHYRAKPAAEKGPEPGSDVIADLSTLRMDKPADWQRKPSPYDLLAVWPKKASAKGIGGKALIHCLVSVQGALYDCFVVSESPAGENFGTAAIALTPQFLMRPATLNGKPVVSTVGMPITWQGGWGGGPQSGSRSMFSATMAWPQAPTYADVAAAYPKKAREKNIGGRATLSCELTREGGLRDCTTVTEEPTGQGFGSAAKALAKQFRAPMKDSDGGSVAGSGVQLPVVFDPAMLTGGKPVIGKAQWARLPTAEATVAAFSTVEPGHGAVRVMLACVVQQGGGVSDCKVEREEPAGIGVGQAALAITPLFRLTTWTAEGLPTVGGTVNIPLRYESGDATPAAKP